MTEGEKGWLTGKIKCRLCGAASLAVFPVEADEDNLECSVCKHMTAEVIAYVTDEGTLKEIE